MATYRIMTFDGGGVRGALMATLLKRLTGHFPALLEKVDLFAGTSTGSVCALALASGFNADTLVEFYSEANLRFAFTPGHWNWFRPKYSNANFRTLLEKHLGHGRLADLKASLVAPSFQLDDRADRDWQPVFFHNFPDSPYLDQPVVDVALRSAAAPTYFPSHQGFIDGGVMANNPSTAAIAMALGHSQPAPQLSDIRLLSIGTGLTPSIIKTNTTGWGAIQWLLNPFGTPSEPILNILFDGVVEADSTMSHDLLGKRYWRLNPLLPRPTTLDDWRAFPELIKTANDYDLGPALDWIESNWD
jgi:patatin-like phospholipase/acyl hydrolase